MRRYSGGDGTALSPQQQTTSSYSGRSGGPGYDIPCSPPQYSGNHCYRTKPFVRRYSGGDGTALSPQQQTTSSYSGCSGGPGYGIPCSPPQYSGSHCYRAKPFVRRYSGGDGTALSPQQQTTSSYSGRSGGPGYDIPCSPPQYSGTHCYRAKPFVPRYSGGDGTALSPQQQTTSSYSGCSGGPGYGIPCSPPQYSGSHCYRAKPFVRRYSGGDGTALSPQQQTTSSYSGRSGGPGYDIPCSPPQYSGTHCYRAKPFVPRYSSGDGTAMSPQHQPAPRPFSSFFRDKRYNCGHRTAPQQQPGPRPFCSFDWEQRGACRDGPPVNGLANSIAQGQAQRDVEMDYHGGPVSKVFGPPETTASLAGGGPPLQARHQRRLQPHSETLSPPTVVISDSAFEEWLQSDNMEMPMFSQSEGPQQSAPTAVTLTAAAPAAEAVTGNRVFPAVSSKRVAEAPASSAGAALAAVPATAPATGGTVFPTASVGGAARAPTSADGIAALTAAPATGSTVLFAASVGGAPASSAVAAASAEISAAEPATSGNVPSAAIGGQSGRASHPLERYHRSRQRRRHRRPAVLLLLLRRRRGRLECSRQQLVPLVKSAARGGRPPTPSIPVPCFRWRSTIAATSEPDITSAAAAVAAAVATTIPTTTTHGGMQPVLEHCCDPLIQGSDAGELRGEGRRF